MKSRHLKSVFAFTITLALGACSSVPSKPTSLVDAHVLNVSPAPEVCRYEKPGSNGNVLIGAIIGGVLGNQFGGGNGRKLATITGAVVGGTAASKGSKSDKMNCRRNGYIAMVAYTHPVSNMYITTSVRLEENTTAQMIEIPVTH